VVQVSDGSAITGAPRGVFASDDGRYVLGLLATEPEWTRLDLVDSAAARLQAVRSVPGELTAIATDAAQSILALATTRDVRFHDLRTLQPFGSSVASRGGGLRALAIAGRTLVLAGADLELYRWDDQSLPSEWAPPEMREVGHRARGPGHVSLTRDGQLLALCIEHHGVAVLHLASGSRHLLLEHGAAVDLVRFVDHDRRLVVATADGRIHIWHRRGDRLAGARQDPTSPRARPAAARAPSRG
jgi:WD40 repeat protein